MHLDGDVVFPGQGPAAVRLCGVLNFVLEVWSFVLGVWGLRFWTLGLKGAGFQRPGLGFLVSRALQLE